MADAYSKLVTKLDLWLENFVLLLPNIGIAIAILLIFIFVSRLLRKTIYKLISKMSVNQTVSKLMSNLLTTAFLIIGLFLALGILGLDKTVTSLLAGAGILGLAIGLAFQDPILNIISGVIMSFKKPFNVGDTVTSNSYNGVIKAISLRSTHLKTFTGEDVFIPNKLVLQNPLENYTLTKWRRVDIQCGVSYTSNLEVVKKIAIEAIENGVEYDKSTAVEFLYSNFGDSSINFELRFWLNLSEEKDYLERKSEAIISIKNAFDANQITIPFPIRTIDFSNAIPGLK